MGDVSLASLVVLGGFHTACFFECFVQAPYCRSVVCSLVLVHVAPVCVFSLTSWRVWSPGWFYLWALDLVEVCGGRVCGEMFFLRGYSVLFVVRAEGCFRIVSDSAISAKVVSGPT
ncbi:hypothetical protein Taro_020684 [Colocasia esculenta]|uniref:Uncharacterized protein n=1 Tax=Colocasia esculenta TaxID=4460 RepID=A0A843V329_COLES|nr:hypothetical protein [Colocasia esculenta]